MLRRFRLLVGFCTVLTVVALPTAVFAADSTATQGIVRSYLNDGTVRQGMIVALKPGDSTRVIAVTKSSVTDVFGVAISPTEAPLTLSGEVGTQVYVATAGQYNVLVSNQNGLIKTGDYVSVSSLNGIGMKAEDTQPTILGRAVGDMTSQSILEDKVAISSAHGTETVAIGVVPVNIAITTNPNIGRGTGDLPGFLQIASSNIADKPVPSSKVYLGMAILLLTAFISGSILFSGVRSGLMSIGRNPLARRSIMGGLIQTIALGVVIFGLGLVGVYLLLKL